MKTFLILLCAAIPVVGAFAQTQAFDVDGIKVIYKPTVKDIVNVSIYFRGGVGNYTADRAGIEKLAVRGAIDCGNASYKDGEFKDRAELSGILIDARAGLDNARIRLNCIAKYFDEGWDLWSAAVTRPSFDANDFEKVKQKAMTDLQQTESDPDLRVRTLAIQQSFAGSPYAIDQDGTQATLSALTSQDASNYYYKTLLNKSRMFIVVVGPVSMDTIRAKIKAAFAEIPSADYKSDLPEPPAIDHNAIHVEERSIATNYIYGIMNAPGFTSPDYVPFLLAFSELNGILFSEIRTQRHLSYAPDAGVRASLLPYSDVYVSTTDPRAAVEVIANVINELESSNVAKKSLEQIKALYITASYMKQESTNAIAESLGLAETLGNWALEEEFPALVSRTTRNEMAKAFKRYVKGISWTYLGDKTKADEAGRAFNIRIK